MIRFLLGGEPHAASVSDPTRTVLQYLREDLGRTGTKEGCAEGDCGACTVVLAERVADGAGERVRYRAVNACIQFMPTLHGKALFTVEDLKEGGALHPAQQAMADCHGSQCGFCTPGIVMSLFALYQAGEAADRQAIAQALSGNLCRCTGYRPILEAGQQMFDLPAPASKDEAILAGLKGLEPVPLALETGAGRFFAPQTLQQLADLREKHPEARIVAGCTDVGLWVTKQHRRLGDVIYLGNVDELKRIEVTDAFIEIGAGATVTDAAPHLVAEYPDFEELFLRYGSPPIRNAATLGGNIANGSPIGDSMPALIALGARVVLRKGAATRELALEDFYLAYQKTALAPGEFVQAVRVPRSAPGLDFRTYKLSKRFDQDISALCAAYAVTLEKGTIKRARIAYGGMAATPKRAPAAEAALAGKPWTEETVRQAMKALEKDYAPITDMRASAEYRRVAATNLLYRFFLETAGTNAIRLYDAEIST